MFRPELAEEDDSSKNAPLGAKNERLGLPVDPRRLVRALERCKRPLIGVLIGSIVLGVGTAKLVLPKTYAAKATLLWEPPTTAHTEGAREITTLAQSVKLPTNMMAVRDELGRKESIAALAKNIDVTFSDNSMLIAVAGKDSEPVAAAALTNSMVNVFLRAQREVAANRLREVVLALRQSLTQSETALAESRGKYDTFRAAHHVDDFPLEIQGAIAETARLRVSAHDAEIELQGLQAQEGALRRAQASNATNVVMSQTEENSDAARLGHAETELSALRAKYSDDHPSVLALSAEVNDLKTRKRSSSRAIVEQTMGRNPVHDALAAQAEGASAIRTAMEERWRTLGTVRHEAEARAAHLTGVQGEAARLLANVNANEEHVNVLLKQIAMAEDDVRVASSGFQLVSSAMVPDRAEKGIGRIVALVFPLLAMLIAMLIVAYRELRPMRVKTAREATYWGRAPVLTSTSWPLLDGLADAPAERHLADVFELRPGVIGVSSMTEGSDAALLTRAVADRLEGRGRMCVIVDARRSLFGHRDAALADQIEDREFSDAIYRLRNMRDHVFVLLPDMSQPLAVRAGLRAIDGLLVVLESGKVEARELAAVRETLGLKGRGIALALTHVSRDLVATTSTTEGSSGDVWARDEDPNATTCWTDGGAKSGRYETILSVPPTPRALGRGAG